MDIDSFLNNTLVSNISVTEEYGKPSVIRSDVSNLLIIYWFEFLYDLDFEGIKHDRDFAFVFV